MDGEEQVGCIGRLDDASPFKFDRLVAKVIEQPLTRTEQHRRQVQPEFVDQPGLPSSSYRHGRPMTQLCSCSPRSPRPRPGPSSGPVMNPSIDIVMSATSFPVTHPPSPPW
jgi:hypothetical protein